MNSITRPFWIGYRLLEGAVATDPHRYKALTSETAA
jgi:hypothetical protein